SMLIAAVMKVMERIPIVRTKAEFAQYEGALESFKADYSADYIPSRIRLCRNLSYYTSNPSPIPNLDSDSISYLKRTIGRNQPSFVAAWNNGIPWNSTASDETLEGHQCLVFFLGGLQTGSAPGSYKCNGFPANWTDLTTLSAPRIQFLSSRLSPPPGKTFC